MKKSKGFTLIELLAVIVILGILLSISIVAVNKIRKTQEEENKKNVISGILTGAKRYVADNRGILSSTNPTINISVSDLKNGDYVDFDETNKNIRDLGLREKIVNVSKCPNNSLKLLYYTNINGVIYNDCGCESQYESTTKSAKLCKGRECTTTDGVTKCDSIE